MNDYVYKDNESGMPKLSAMLTSRMGDGSGNHEAAYLDTINLLVAAFSGGSMLDIGCGMGRITQAAAGRVSELVALEPDAARCNWTREAVGEAIGVAAGREATSVGEAETRRGGGGFTSPPSPDEQAARPSTSPPMIRSPAKAIGSMSMPRNLGFLSDMGSSLPAL